MSLFRFIHTCLWYSSIPCRYDLMQSSWNESPEERPTFLQLVYAIASLLGEETIQGCTVPAGPPDTCETSHSTSLYTNGSLSTTSIPIEYEVPVQSLHKAPKGALRHTSVPTPGTVSSTSTAQYGVVSAASNGTTPANTSHTPFYHTLEEPMATVI